MSQADQSQQLVMICHKMHQEGLQPGVGLLRARAPFKVSVTQAIDAIKAWNASSKMPATPASDAGDRVAALEKRVSEMESAIAILEQRLAQLSVKTA